MENRDRDRALGRATIARGLDDAPPSEPIYLPKLRTEAALKTPQVDFPSTKDVVPGEIPVPSCRAIVTTWTVRDSSNSDEFSSEFTNEESTQDEEEPNSAGAYTGAPDGGRMASENGLYMKQDKQVPDGSHGNEVGSMMAGEAQKVGTQWHQRPVYRWLLVGCILLVCGLVVAVIALAILLNRSAQSASNSMEPELIACQFLSMPNLTTCQSTQSFDSYNTDDRTTGSRIPSEIGLLTQLTYLDLSGNQLTSTIPTEIGLLTQLTYLDLSGNQLTSTIPTEIGLLRRLMRLAFYNNSLTSEIPSEIGLLTQLAVLSFSVNSLTSTIPSEIVLLTQLSVFDLSDNELKGTIPSSLCSLSSLFANINIDCGEITCDSGCCVDDALPCAPSSSSPTFVPITEAPFTSDPTAAPAAPASITGAPITSDPTSALPTTVFITGAPATPDPTVAPITLEPITAPPAFAPTSLMPEAIACNFLSIPDVTTCRSTFVFDSFDTTTGSTIPSEIGLLTQLTYLAFYANSLTSTIPSEIGFLTQLTYLSFFDNSLTSTIPSEIGLLTQLMELDLTYNLLTSTIPTQIGLLTQLTYLSFFDNSLTSTIPSEIGLLTQLRLLDFSFNWLTFTIPSEIGHLTQLEWLQFGSNELTGTIASSLCSLPRLVPIYIDCGEITCASGCCWDRFSFFCD